MTRRGIEPGAFLLARTRACARPFHQSRTGGQDGWIAQRLEGWRRAGGWRKLGGWRGWRAGGLQSEAWLASGGLAGWRAVGLEGWQAGGLEGLEGWRPGGLAGGLALAEGWRAAVWRAGWRALQAGGRRTGRLEDWRAGEVEGWRAGGLEGEWCSGQGSVLRLVSSVSMPRSADRGRSREDRVERSVSIGSGRAMHV